MGSYRKIPENMEEAGPVMLAQIENTSNAHRILSSLRALFFTSNCLLCQQESNEIICKYCLEDCHLPTFNVPGENLLESPQIMANRSAPIFHELHAIGWHEGILAQLIYRLKFGRQQLAAKALAYLFYKFVLYRLSQVDDLPDAIIPVPVSNLRLMQRGFNQAQLLAEYLTQYQPINIVQAVKKTRHTKQQSTMQRDQRLLNTTNAFELRDTTPYNHVCIIDDVLTTGTTVNQISELILENNPHAKISVWCMSLARFNKN